MDRKKARRRIHRISRYTVGLHAMISAEMSAEIERLADAAEWPASEVVRQALAVGLPEVGRIVARDEEGTRQ